MSTTYAQKTHAETTHSRKIQIKNTNNMEQKESSETGTTNQYRPTMYNVRYVRATNQNDTQAICKRTDHKRRKHPRSGLGRDLT